jgi:hypothetical protein
MRWAVVVFLIGSCAGEAAPFQFVPQAVNVYASAGQNRMNRHGHSVFHSVRFEVVGRSPILPRWLRSSPVGVALTYSAVRQARSWFGYTYGDPDDSVRAESLCVFVRHESARSWLRLQPYVETGTGLMWSNRRIPAATSRLNFDSEFAIGAVVFPRSRAPVRIGYRFSHISNAGMAGRNPGVNLSSFFVGMRVKVLRGAARAAAPPLRN